MVTIQSVAYCLATGITESLRRTQAWPSARVVVSPPAPRSLLLLQPHLADSPSPAAAAASFSERHVAGLSAVEGQEGRSGNEGGSWAATSKAAGSGDSGLLRAGGAGVVATAGALPRVPLSRRLDEGGVAAAADSAARRCSSKTSRTSWMWSVGGWPRARSTGTRQSAGGRALGDACRRRTPAAAPAAALPATRNPPRAPAAAPAAALPAHQEPATCACCCSGRGAPSPPGTAARTCCCSSRRAPSPPGTRRARLLLLRPRRSQPTRNPPRLLLLPATQPTRNPLVLGAQPSDEEE
ncbi:uncharacterized protein C10orf95-like [Sorghum bicolor]|uniref:uncharacterized protein C10orf95-like n=1 Tax=Sorghum bicolor TaxID=4558 RepID=UPI000B42402D|nr:uncharacterized protein C10orf95-like [Sorghum bicolor]|eukprot:XP_021315245.1 uncharacterized protein C10orf95-like [Sorghum bicolor]